jgi:hypothetical protein
MDVIDAILDKVVDVSKEAYGNYVIQHILEKGNEYDRIRLLQTIKAKVLELSRHKFAR